MIKLQVPAAKRQRPRRRSAPRLASIGVNIPGFRKELNERTCKDAGLIIPVVITVYSDRTFTFITKNVSGAPCSSKEAGLEHASGRPRTATCKASSPWRRCTRSPSSSARTLNATDIASIESMVAGTCALHGHHGEE